MNALSNHIALKEWNSVIAALGSGEQFILIRKGGIADAAFGLEANRFYLFPTNFHEGGGQSPSPVPITHWCEVVRTWQVRDLDTLLRLEPLVLFDRATLEQRVRFRPDQAIYVIAVRTFELRKPANVEMKEDYGGCRSWISVDEEIDVDGSRPVLSDSDLRARIETVDALLAAAV
jgi:hypothetical protein